MPAAGDHEPTIRVFGPTTVVLDGEARLVTGHTGRVIAALTAAHPRWFSRDDLADAIWPGARPATAASALRTYLTRTRRLVEAAGLGLDAESGQLRIVGPAHLVVDALAFEEIGSTLAEGASGGPSEVADRIDELDRLWRGRPFEGIDDHPVVEGRRSTLAHLRDRLRDRRAEALIEAGRAHDAVADLEVRLQHDPFHEHRWILLARALQQTGRNVDALGAVRQAMALLREDLGLEPGTALRDAELAILRHGEDPGPPLRDPSAAHRLAAIAALDPGGITLPVLAMAAGLSPADALDELRGEIASGTIEEIEGETVRYRTVDASLTDALGPTLVIEHSRALFDALDAVRATASDRLRHAVAAADVLGAAVGPTLVDATDELLGAGDYQTVVELARWLDHGAPISPRDRLAVDAAALFADAATGRSTDADSALLELAATAAADDDWDNLGRALRLRAELGHAFTADPEEEELLARALDAVDDDHPLLRFDLLELRFYALLHAGAGADVVEPLWRDAATFATASGLADRRARASHMEHQVASLRGEHGPSVTRISQRTRRFAASARDRTLEAKAIADLLADALASHDLIAAGTYCDELLGGPDPHGRWVGHLWRGALHLDQFDLAAAAASGEEATRVGIRHGIVAAADATISQQVVLLWIEGRLGEIVPLLSGEDWERPSRAAWGGVLALAHTAAGELDDAARVATAVSEHVEVTGASGWSEPVTHACLLEVAHRCGLPEVAARSARHLAPWGRSRIAVGSVDFGPADRFLALGAATTGDLAQAEQLLTRSARLAHCPLWELRVAIDREAIGVSRPAGRSESPRGLPGG